MEPTEMVMMAEDGNASCFYSILKTEDGEPIFVDAEGNLIMPEPHTDVSDSDTTVQAGSTSAPMTIYDLSQISANFEIQVALRLPKEEPGLDLDDVDIKTEPGLEEYDDVPEHGLFTGASWEELVKEEHIGICHICGQAFDSQMDLDRHIEVCDENRRNLAIDLSALLKSGDESSKPITIDPVVNDSSMHVGVGAGRLDTSLDCTDVVPSHIPMVYACRQCNQTFESLARLVSHRLSHSRHKKSRTGSMQVPVEVSPTPMRSTVSSNPGITKCMTRKTSKPRSEQSTVSTEISPRRTDNHIDKKDLLDCHVGEANVMVEPARMAAGDCDNKNQSKYCHSSENEIVKEPNITNESVCTQDLHSTENSSDMNNSDTVGGKSKRSYTCKLCPKRYVTRRSLQHHMRVHTGEKPFQCEICGMEFARRPQYARHMIHHTGKKPHKCDLCGKQFAWPDDLRRHKFSHTGEKPFICEICGMKFVKQYNATQHMQARHMNIRTFACEYCGKMFHRHHHVKQHMRAHTGEKPYSCPHCSKCFTQKWCLRQHITIHSGVRPYECEVCGRKFTQKHSVKQHMKTHKSVHVNT